ncbi:hypothetical protein Ciccas_009809 [Cichlidogyrus casuarinus]|uniref:C2H2-type domain-containing protein n=1 Tax=Cichlidogyrus casuarinus TaxID=1844966 RepID=A0ABD2PYR9_9PLAT
MLVLNANWRGRSYVGSLIDATKNSMGPSCSDKSVSSLSLLRNRNWRGGTGGAGLYRNRPGSLGRAGLVSPRLHHASHMHHHYHLSGLSNIHGPVTTRSAAAAANSSDDRSQPNEGKLVGAKRRSKRNGRPFHETHEEDAVLSPNNGAAESLPFQCPFVECDKRFPSLISLRFHTQMGHQWAASKRVPKSSIGDSAKSVHVRKRRKLGPRSSPQKPPKLETSAEKKEEEKGEQEGEKEKSEDDELQPPKLVVEEERVNPVPSPAYSDISDDGAAPPSCDPELLLTTPLLASSNGPLTVSTMYFNASTPTALLGAGNSPVAVSPSLLVFPKKPPPNGNKYSPGEEQTKPVLSTN